MPMEIVTGERPAVKVGCRECGLPEHLHRETTGNFTLRSCQGARIRDARGWTKDALCGTVLAQDLFPDYTRLVLDTMRVDCGAQMAYHAENSFTPSELLIIARQIANRIGFAARCGMGRQQ